MVRMGQNLYLTLIFSKYDSYNQGLLITLMANLHLFLFIFHYHENNYFLHGIIEQTIVLQNLFFWWNKEFGMVIALWST